MHKNTYLIVLELTVQKPDHGLLFFILLQLLGELARRMLGRRLRLMVGLDARAKICLCC
jgi:hypothetical protein